MPCLIVGNFRGRDCSAKDCLRRSKRENKQKVKIQYNTNQKIRTIRIDINRPSQDK
jgi:hypothetical protein